MTRTVGSRLLIPLDGSALSAQAVSLARALATPEATFVLLHVVPPLEDERGLLGGLEAESETLTEIEVRQDQANVERGAAQLKADLAPTQQLQVIVLAGNPAETIMAQAQSLNCDTIVMASRGRGALGRLIFGSVTDQVTREATVPVAVMNPQNVDDEQVTFDLPLDVMPLTRLVLPLDGSEAGQLAIEAAIPLAQRLKLPVLLLTAVDPVPLSAPAYGADMGMAIGAAELITAFEEDARAWLNEAHNRFETAGVSSEAKLVYGTPVAAITDQLEPGDLIVMTTRGRAGFERFVLGSVAEGLIRAGEAPVLLVR